MTHTGAVCATTPDRDASSSYLLTRGLRALRGIARYRLVLLGVGAVALACLGPRAYPPDFVMFAHLGGDLLNGRLGDVYADAFNQSGPLQLIASALFQLDSHLGAGLLLLHIIGDLAVVAALIVGSRVCRRASGLTPSPVAELIVGLAALAWIVPGDLWNGHLAGLAVPGLWLAGAEAARRGHPYLAATLLAISAGVEPWGVLGFGILLIERRPTVLLRAAALAGALTVALYVPFALTGNFHLFDQTWPVSDVSVVHLLWPDAEQFTWRMRMAQGAASSLACAAVVMVLRHRSGAVIWTAPLAAILFRLLLDPTVFSYYWVPVCLLVLVGASTLSATSSRAAVVATLSLAYLPFVKVASVTWLNLALTIAALVAVVWCARAAQVPGGRPLQPGQDEPAPLQHAT